MNTTLFEGILTTFGTVWNNVKSWFMNITSATGSFSYILGIIFAMLVIRFTVYPFFKNRVVSAGSDKAKKDVEVKEGFQ